MHCEWPWTKTWEKLWPTCQRKMLSTIELIHQTWKILFLIYKAGKIVFWDLLIVKQGKHIHYRNIVPSSTKISLSQIFGKIKWVSKDNIFYHINYWTSHKLERVHKFQKHAGRKQWWERKKDCRLCTFVKGVTGILQVWVSVKQQKHKLNSKHPQRI